MIFYNLFENEIDNFWQISYITIGYRDLKI